VEQTGANPAERFFAILGCSVAALGVFAVLLELSCFAFLSAYRRFHSDPLGPQKSPAYKGEPWGREFWNEQTSFWANARSNYLPFTVWGARKWHGQYINTDDSEMGTWRRTIQAMSEGCTKTRVRRIWVFGGSTVFGIGTPDSETIPSYLSRDLNTDPSACVDVINLGADGYVTNQEVILLMQELKAGRQPDIAVFYDGVNESLVGGFSPGIPTAHWQFETIKAKFESPAATRLGCLKLLYSAQVVGLLMEILGPDDRMKVSDGELAVRAQATLENYEANLKLAQILAKAYGFKAYFFWQPVLAYGDKPLVPFERELRDSHHHGLGEVIHRGLNAVYQQAENRSAASGNFVFLGHAFDKVQEPLYVDGFHLDSRGNEIIAHAIAQTIRLETLDPPLVAGSARENRPRTDGETGQ
jgi:lysophospholipase L1-like esterase